MRFKIIVDPEETDPWLGPLWEPVVHDGKFPLTAHPGDLYINRFRDPPLIYVFVTPTICEMTSSEEVKGWVTGGLMKRPGPVQLNEETSSKKPLGSLPSTESIPLL